MKKACANKEIERQLRVHAKKEEKERKQGFFK
jgi:hypothetical protein